MKIIINLNLLCSLCPLAFADPMAEANPEIIRIEVQQIIGSSGISKGNVEGQSIDGPEGKGSAGEGPGNEAQTTEGHTTEAPKTTKQPCLPPWVNTEEGCYQFFDIMKSWDDADDLCFA